MDHDLPQQFSSSFVFDLPPNYITNPTPSPSFILTPGPQFPNASPNNYEYRRVLRQGIDQAFLDPYSQQSSFSAFQVVTPGYPLHGYHPQYSVGSPYNYQSTYQLGTREVGPPNGDEPPYRTTYVGNFPIDAHVDELLDLVGFGPVESVRILPEKSCAFISFLDHRTAAAFHADATVKRLTLRGHELKIGWGKPSAVACQVMLSISQSNASRNVYLGGLDERVSEEALKDDLSRFGPIDQVRIVPDRNIAFVHFLSISVATKVVATLPTEPSWAGKRINYGKDRCTHRPKSHQVAQLAAQVSAAQSLVARQWQSVAGSQTQSLANRPRRLSATNAMSFNSWELEQGINRTVYLGNIHPETTTEDLCNTIRGGLLQSIKYLPDKHTAFVTFVDPTAAFCFYQMATFHDFTLHNRRLKVGWGKNSGPLPPTLALAIHAGATRNVYIGDIVDFGLFTEERLKSDFREFGEIELVNFFKEKNCAFVNFTNISSAIKSIEGMKTKPIYVNLRLAYGKDRCANSPRFGAEPIRWIHHPDDSKEVFKRPQNMSRTKGQHQIQAGGLGGVHIDY